MYIVSIATAAALWWILAVCLTWLINIYTDKIVGLGNNGKRIRSRFLILVISLTQIFPLSMISPVQQWIENWFQQYSGEENFSATQARAIFKEILHSKYRKIVIWLSLFQVTVVKPMAEEIIFRGPLLILFGGMGVSFLSVCGVAVSAALFGIVHYYFHVYFALTRMLSGRTNPPISRNLRLRAGMVHTVSGAIFGIVCLYFDTIWAAVFAHSLWNIGGLLLLSMHSWYVLKHTGHTGISRRQFILGHWSR